jgi:hypothetical protein
MVKDDLIPKGGGVPRRTNLYNIVAPKGREIINTLFALLKSNNEGIRLGAAKVLINKILPDLQAIQHKGEIELKYPRVFIPQEKDE